MGTCRINSVGEEAARVDQAVECLLESGDEATSFHQLEVVSEEGAAVVEPGEL